MKTVISFIILLSANLTMADDFPTKVGIAHDAFATVAINGDAAKTIYENMQTKERQETGHDGQLVDAFSKYSADGSMWCLKNPKNARYHIAHLQGETSYSCRLSINPSQGSIIFPYIGVDASR